MCDPHKMTLRGCQHIHKLLLDTFACFFFFFFWLGGGGGSKENTDFEFLQFLHRVQNSSRWK